MAVTTIWILGDQLLADHPALTPVQNDSASVRVLLVENWRRARRLPYHQQKITLLFSAMRHYAERLRSQGITVDYVQTDDLSAALRDHTKQHGATHIITMAASEYKGRLFQQQRLAELTGATVEVLPNTQFLIGRHDPYPDAKKQVILENFYRAMRRHHDLLMDADGQPEGGAWNFDKDNRKPLPKKGLTLPDLPAFPPDDLTRTVMDEVTAAGIGMGSLDNFGYAVTHEQAQQALDAFIRQRLAGFGRYEDAMTRQHRTLFHSVLSPYVNIGLLTPLAMAQAAVAAYQTGDAPLNSVEGFVRQVIGWREYMAWQYWRQMPGLAEANAWEAQRPVPRMFWDGQTDMNCIRHVVEGLLATGYSHHIERLMIVSNFFMLAGVRPQDAVRWFSALYIDAYDWVMQPNVIGMGLNADGGKTATKPYIASASYINRMSDYCAGCAYDPKQRHGANACPFNTLYWNFLIEHADRLRANPRSGPAVLGLKHLDNDERAQVQAQAQAFLATLEANTDE